MRPLLLFIAFVCLAGCGDKHAPPPAKPLELSAAEKQQLDVYNHGLSHFLTVRDDLKSRLDGEFAVARSGTSGQDRMKQIAGTYSRWGAEESKQLAELMALQPPPSAKKIHDWLVDAEKRMIADALAASKTAADMNDVDLPGRIRALQEQALQFQSRTQDLVIHSGFDYDVYMKDRKLVPAR